MNTTIKRFGIYAPVLGKREDFPVILIDDAFTPECENIHLWNGEVRKAKSRLKELVDGSSNKVATPDGFPVLRYARLWTSSEIERLVAFTKAHAYYWRTDTKAWSLIFTCSSNCEYWDVDQYGDYLVATNNIDRPIKWDGETAGACTNLDTQISATTAEYISKAKFIKCYRDYIVFANFEVQGTQYTHEIIWCNIGEGVDASGFRQDLGGDAGSAYIDGDGEITGGFGLKLGYLIVFKRWSTRKVWFTGNDIPFEQEVCLPSTGCTAPGSVINDRDGRLYFYGTDRSIREIDIGKISQAIDDTIRNINPTYTNLIRSICVDEYDQLWWSIPYGSGATANNKVVIFKDGKWTEKTVAITAFGKYTRQYEYSWNTLPYNTNWLNWDWNHWNEPQGGQDAIIDICSDASGYTYSLYGAYTDDGSEYTSSFVLATDFAKAAALPFYKRLLGMNIYVKNAGSGTLSVYVKEDTGASWQYAGSVSLDGDDDILRQWLPVDFRAKHFKIKFSGTTVFEFVGVDFEFMFDGDR